MTWTQTNHPHLKLLRDYFDAIERDVDESELAVYFSPSVRQHEFPNRLVGSGATRGLVELQRGRRRGRQAVKNERYEITNALVDGDRVAIEMRWSAELKLPFGKLAAGDSMVANCGVFFRIQDGRIVEQHNFDCFDPF